MTPPWPASAPSAAVGTTCAPRCRRWCGEQQRSVLYLGICEHLFVCVVGPRTHQTVTSFQGEFPSVDDIGVAERALQDMRALIQLMQEEVAKFQEKKKKEQEQEQESQKQVELQAQQEAQKAAAQLAKAKAQKKG